MMFLMTFVVMLVVIAIMAVGIKGSCGGGMDKAACVCVEKCDKRKKLDAQQAAEGLSNQS